MWGTECQDGVHEEGQGVQSHLEVELLAGLQQRGDEVPAAEGDAQGGDQGQAALRRGRLSPAGQILAEDYQMIKSLVKDTTIKARSLIC